MLGHEATTRYQPHNYAKERSYFEKTQERITSRHQQPDIKTSQPQVLRVEADFIDSFLDFANYLDKVNPICPADTIDTVDKLLKILGQR